MSIFFATPMYGGMCHAQFHRSAMETAIEMTKSGVRFTWSTPYNESLITRARNKLVQEFLCTDLEYLFFIDADIEFCVEDIATLWNHQLPCAAAAYAMKRPDSPLSAWKDGELLKITDDKEFKKDSKHIYSGGGLIEVDYAGTGFFLVSRETILTMQEIYKELKYTEDVGEMYALYDTSIHDDTYLSEDYTFCKRLRDTGGRVMLDPSIKLKHWGQKAYGG